MVKEDDGTLTINTNSGVIDKVDCLIWAIGRTPNSDKIGLDRVVIYLSECCSFFFFLQSCS